MSYFPECQILLSFQFCLYLISKVPFGHQPGAIIVPTNGQALKGARPSTGTEMIEKPSDWRCILTPFTTNVALSERYTAKLLSTPFSWILLAANAMVSFAATVAPAPNLIIIFCPLNQHIGPKIEYGQEYMNKNDRYMVGMKWKWINSIHWCHNKITHTLQTTFWNVFFLMKIIIFRFKFNWSQFLMV